MLRPTPTLVLSPLIALMKDQVDKLPAEVAAQATLINSSLDPDEAATLARGRGRRRYRLLYVAPGGSDSVTSSTQSPGSTSGLVVLDEVHCVNVGHDFRPDYLFIRRVLDALGRPAILGMTRDGDARDGAGDRGRARRGGGRAHECRPAEPALRRRDRRRRGGSPPHARPQAPRPSRRLGDRLRPFAPKLRDPGTHTSRPRSRRRPLPRREQVRGARRPERSSRADPDRRRDHCLRDGDRQARHPARRSTTTPSRSRATCRWSAAPGGGRPSDTLLASRSDANQLRRFARSGIRRSPTSAPSTHGCAAGARRASGGAW